MSFRTVAERFVAHAEAGGYERRFHAAAKRAAEFVGLPAAHTGDQVERVRNLWLRVRFQF